MFAATLLSLALVLAAPAVNPPLYMGGDISEIPEVEASGAVFRVNGKQQDPLKIMKDAGWTAVRLRVWNNPADGYCDFRHTLNMAKRIHQSGLRLMIDFHYSDSWADPQKQNKPNAWKVLKLEGLEAQVFSYSRDVVKALCEQGTPPEVVQPGNEVTNGFLWPEGGLRINGDGWEGFMRLNTAAIKGIRAGAGSHKPLIMMHIDQGGRNAVSRFWFDNYFRRGGEADIIGLSYYPFWHGTLQELAANLADLSRTYHKPLIIAETAFHYKSWGDEKTPVPGIPETPAGQAEYLRQLNNVVAHVPDRRGAGILWWAPAWIGIPGGKGGWQRLTLFDNDSGEALPGLKVLSSGN